MSASDTNVFFPDKHITLLFSKMNNEIKKIFEVGFIPINNQLMLPQQN